MAKLNRLGHVQMAILQTLYFKPPFNDGSLPMFHHAAGGVQWLKHEVHRRLGFDAGFHSHDARFSRALQSLQRADLVMVFKPSSGSLVWAPQINPTEHEVNNGLHEPDGSFAWRFAFAVHPNRVIAGDHAADSGDSLKIRRVVVLFADGQAALLARHNRRDQRGRGSPDG